MTSRPKTRCPPSGLGSSSLYTHIASHTQETVPDILYITKSYLFLSLLPFSLLPYPSLRENNSVYWLIKSAFSFTFQSSGGDFSLVFCPLYYFLPALATPWVRSSSLSISSPTYSGAASCPIFASAAMFTTKNRRRNTSSIFSRRTQWPSGCLRSHIQEALRPLPLVIADCLEVEAATQCSLEVDTGLSPESWLLTLGPPLRTNMGTLDQMVSMAFL